MTTSVTEVPSAAGSDLHASVGLPGRPSVATSRHWARWPCHSETVTLRRGNGASASSLGGLRDCPVGAVAGSSAAVKLALATSQGPGGTVVVNGMESEPASDKATKVF